MKRSFTASLQLGFWLCYIILVGVIIGVLYGTQENVVEAKIERSVVTIIFFALIPSAVSFYSFYYLVFPRLSKQKNLFTTILMGLGASVLGGIVGYVGLYNLYGDNCLSGAENAESDPLGLITFISFISLICGIIALVIRGFATWFEELKLKEELRKKNHAMELALVKAQLDPHFLFNTINNIDVLILKDATEASTYLNKLSDIMRFMLYETKTDEIPLEKEIEYIEKYIELQKIRTANLNYINFTKEGSAEGKEIAPMVFAPFIENAFKHTTNKKIDHAITIKLKMENDKVSFECANKYDVNRKLKKEMSGLGNELIQKRLNLLYPNQHQLKVSNDDEIYRVQLIIHYA